VIDPGTTIDRVTLRVSDIARAQAFYAGVLGLEAAGDDLRSPNGGPVLIELTPSERTGEAPRHATGLFHTALRWPTRAGLGGVLHRVATSNVPLTGASDHGVSEALYLDDPDGNGVELYWDRPRDRWPEPEGDEKVHMFTAPLDLRDLLAVGATEDDGIDIGHVHLKTADLDVAEAFWGGDVGFELMTRYGTEASFMAAGGYHHHLGLNTWYSRGTEPGDPALPGLERVVLAVPGAEGRQVAAPEGVGLEISER
jgi:catechol 2,3-dioxygenase